MRHEPGPANDLRGDLAAHRPYLLNLALLQLRDAARAEDAVQETMLAAIEHLDGFDGRSSLRTWLIGILRNKIVDIIRRQARERPASEGSPAAAGAELDALFDAKGKWRDGPRHWSDPEGALESEEFWRVFEICRSAMPTALAQVFMMRELLELGTGEICKALGISPSNCHVMLYRARMRLRRCLDENWFEGA
jgi:RNA polymerase sigma-70 factor (ECF subfamily)